MMGSRGRGGRARTAGSLGLFLAHSASRISGISRFSGSGARLSRHSALGMPARRAVTWVTGQGPFAPQEVPCAFQGSPALLPKARERRKFIRACCFKGTLRCHRATAPACVCACGCGVSSAAWAGAASGRHTQHARTTQKRTRAHTALSSMCASASSHDPERTAGTRPARDANAPALRSAPASNAGIASRRRRGRGGGASQAARQLIGRASAPEEANNARRSHREAVNRGALESARVVHAEAVAELGAFGSACRAGRSRSAAWLPVPRAGRVAVSFLARRRRDRPWPHDRPFGAHTSSTQHLIPASQQPPARAERFRRAARFVARDDAQEGISGSMVACRVARTARALRLHTQKISRHVFSDQPCRCGVF
jgi:hypothetical protein